LETVKKGLGKGEDNIGNCEEGLGKGEDNIGNCEEGLDKEGG
jgi:hypothetical protein